MSFEIERKFLLTSDEIIKLLEQDGLDFIKKYIQQIYIKITQDFEIRLRKIDNEHFLTKKSGIGLKRQESEEVIIEDIYNASKKGRVGSKICKTRHIFRLQNLKANIDVYDKKFKNLVVLELEFDREDEAKEFKLPDFFGSFIMKEITNDESFKNKNLALYGLKEPFGFEEFIKKNDFTSDDFLSKLPKTICAYDGLRVILSNLVRRVEIYESQDLQNEKNLHFFRINLRKICLLFNELKGVFDDSISKKITSDIKNIYKSTNQKSDFDAFKKYLHSIDDIEAEHVLELLKFCEDKKNEPTPNLNCEKTIQEILVLINDDDKFFQGSSAELAFKKLGSSSLLKRFSKLRKKVNGLHEYSSLQDFHAIRLEFKKLRFMSEFFIGYFDKKSMKKSIKISKKMQKLFGRLQDLDAGLEILKSIENDQRFCTDILAINATQVVQEIINDEIYGLKYKILRDKKELLSTLNVCLKEFKIYIG